MSDVVGAASVEISPDSTGFSDALSAQINEALSSVSSSLSDSIAGAASTATIALDDVAGAATGVGQAVQTAGDQGAGGLDTMAIAATALGVAIGTELANGVEFMAGKVNDMVTALPNLGESIQGNFNSIRIATGATGEELRGLEGSFNKLATSTPASMDDVAKALSVVNARLNLSGEEAEKVSLGFIRFSRLTKTDLGSNLQSLTGTFNQFNITADQQVGKMDELFRVYQATGIPVSELTSGMNRLGPIARQLGLSFEDTASVMGQLSQAGLNAGSVQMAFTKILAKAAKDGVSGGEELRRVFTGIQTGTIDMGEAMKIFGPRAAAVIDLIKSGKLNYQQLSAEIATGGDTLKQAASDTRTWGGQLDILGNQIKVTLEPIALIVFGAMTDAAITLRPIIADLAQTVFNFLTPAFVGILAVIMPVWEMFGRLAKQWGNLMSAIGAGDAQGIGEVLDNVLGNTGKYVDGIAGAAQSIFDAWDKIKNAVAGAWEVISPIFDEIRARISAFVAENPEAVFAGVATAITVLLVPALVTLGGIVASAVGTVVTFASGFLAVPLAIGAVVAGLIWAWNNFEGFRNVVNGVVSWFQENVPRAFEVVREKLDQLWPLLQSVGDGFKGMWDQIQPALSGLWGSLKPLVEWLIDNWRTLAGILLLPLLPLKLIWDHLGQIVEVLKPFVAGFADLIGNVLSNAINVISGVVDVLTGLFTLDWGKVGDGLYKVGSAILDFMGNLGGHIVDLLKAIIPKLAEWFGTLVSNIPGWIGTALGALLGALGSLLSNIPGWLLSALAGLGSLLVTALTAAWDWLVQNGPGILANVATWLGSLPGMILGWLGSLGEKLGEWLMAAFDWVVQNSVTLLGNLISWALTIPALLVQGLWNLGGLLLDWMTGAWDWLVENGPTILANLWNWVSSLPGVLVGLLANLGLMLVDWITGAWQWLVDNGPTILTNLWAWVQGLPGMLIGKLGDIGSMLLGWLKAGFQWVVDNGPDIIQGVVDFFGGLPGKIFDAITNGLGAAGGAISDLAKSLYNAIAGFVNEHLLAPVRTFKVTILGKDFTPFEGIPELTKFATGGIVDRPTLGVFGEAGREALVPLANEQAGVATAIRAGIPGMLQRAGVFPQVGTQGGVTVVVNVAPPPGADQGWAERLGDAVGRTAGDVVQRKLQIRAAVRAA